jgi:glucose-1-phosphate adenylyltransferase
MGTADAVYQNLDIIQSGIPPDFILVLAGDHVYKMDYSIMVADHVSGGKGVTVGCLEVPREEATAFGVMGINEQRLITSFVEKPADPPPMPGRPDRALGSMGIYVFSADYLYRALEEDVRDPGSNHDFGKDIIPKAVAEGQGARPSVLDVVHPESAAHRAVLARRRHGRRVLGANLDLASPRRR